jgi:ATP-dependent Zn protease
MKHPQAELTAYHEAGHAVIALVHDRPVHRVSILPKQGRLGQCEFGKAVFRPSEDALEREILIALAGFAAEARYAGTYALEGADRDLRYVRRLVLERKSERAATRYEERMLAKVEALLGDEGIWKAVEQIASELLKHGEISGRSARHIYVLATKED